MTNTGNTKKCNFRDTIVIKEKFDYFCASRTGEIIAVVVNPDGSTTEKVVDFYKTPSQSLITDGKGDSLVITKYNKFMGLSEFKATGGNKALLNEYLRKKDSAAVWYVNFDKYDDQKFGFNKYSANKNKSLYSYLNADSPKFTDSEIEKLSKVFGRFNAESYFEGALSNYLKE